MAEIQACRFKLLAQEFSIGDDRSQSRQRIATEGIQNCLSLIDLNFFDAVNSGHNSLQIGLCSCYVLIMRWSQHR